MWRQVTRALNPEIPEGFQESSFTGHRREGGHRTCDSLVHGSLVGKVTGS